MENLKHLLNATTYTDYAWSLYFFKIQAKCPDFFFTDKVKLSPDHYLNDYSSLLFEKLENKLPSFLDNTFCYSEDVPQNGIIKIPTEHEMIAERWNKFRRSLLSEEKANHSNRYDGYCLLGQNKGRPEDSDILFAKISEPLYRANTKKFFIFNDNHLKPINDLMFCLQTKIDFMICKNNLYAFNTKFTKLFCKDSYLHQHKSYVIQQIINKNIFSSNLKLEDHFNSIPAHHYFVSFEQRYLDELSFPSTRKNIAEKLGLDTDDTMKIVVNTVDHAKILLKHLCHRYFNDLTDDKAVFEAYSPRQHFINKTKH